MLADKLLNQLEKVKQIGDGRWIACCSGHEDKSPSLSIKEIDDKVIIHCFAGCSAYDIVSGAGLEMTDLYPERIKGVYSKPIAKPFNSDDALIALASDMEWMDLICVSLLESGKLSVVDHRRIKEIADRFRKARQVAGL